jgi:hypothetical protein
MLNTIHDRGTATIKTTAQIRHERRDTPAV